MDANVRNCVETYTSDYVVVQRNQQHLSSSRRIRDESEERLKIIDNVPAHEFEVDDTPEITSELEQVLPIPLHFYRHS